MAAFVENCFTGPVLPASILLLLVTCYWLLVVVTGMGLDALNLDFDIDADSIGELSSAWSLGMVGLRFFNLGRMPLMIWLSVFSLSFWTISMILDHPSHRATWSVQGLMLLRNVALASVITKLLTQPLVKFFLDATPNRSEDLIGRPCTITTLEATDKFGQARLGTEGSPLLLNVRCMDGELVKGDVAQIVDFDPDRNVYIVTKANSEV